MRTVLALAISSLLAGCVGVAAVMGAHVKAYEGPQKPDSEIATLFTPIKEVRPSGRAYLNKVDEEIYGDDMFRGWPVVVNILPGRHKITIKCTVVGYKVAYPAFTARFDAGHYYELTCKDLGNGSASGSFVDRGTESNVLNPPKQ
jgi:hypothetical protein